MANTSFGCSTRIISCHYILRHLPVSIAISLSGCLWYVMTSLAFMIGTNSHSLDFHLTNLHTIGTSIQFNEKQCQGGSCRSRLGFVFGNITPRGHGVSA